MAKNASSEVEAQEPQAAEPNSEEKLDRLREIIFGAELHETAKESARLEELISSETASLRSDLGEIDRGFDARFKELDERFSKAQSDLREQLVSQFNLLNDTIQERTEQTNQTVEGGLEELRANKIDRKALAELLIQIAGQIHHDGDSASLGKSLWSSSRPSRSSP